MNIDKHLPPILQLSYSSYSGSVASYLADSCIGNHLDKTWKKVVAYIPRILIALPTLTLCASLDLAALALKIVVCYPFACCCGLFFTCTVGLSDGKTLLCDLISTLALPLILSISLLLDRIPEPHRRTHSLWNGRETNEAQDREHQYAQRAQQASTVLQAAFSGDTASMCTAMDRIDPEIRTAVLHAPGDIPYNGKRVYGPPGLGAILQGNVENVKTLFKDIDYAQLTPLSRFNILYAAFQAPLDVLEEVAKIKNISSSLSLFRYFENSLIYRTYYTLYETEGNAIYPCKPEEPQYIPTHHRNMFPFKMNAWTLEQIAFVADGAAGIKKLHTLSKTNPIFRVHYVQLSQFLYFQQPSEPIEQPSEPINDFPVYIHHLVEQQDSVWIFQTEKWSTARVVNGIYDLYPAPGGAIAGKEKNIYCTVWEAHKEDLVGTKYNKDSLQKIIQDEASSIGTQLSLDTILPRDLRNTVTSYLVFVSSEEKPLI